MLDLRYLVANTEAVKESLHKRNRPDLYKIVDELVTLDKQRRDAIQATEKLKAERNLASTEIAKVKKAGGDAAALLESMKEVAKEIKRLDDLLIECEEKVKLDLLEIPNVLQDTVIAGKDSSANVEIKQWGTKAKLDFIPKSHDEIGEDLGILNFKKAGEVTGARFVFEKGLAAKLERALIQLMLDTHGKHQYEEINPPFLVNRASLYGTGTLPKFAEDVFHIEKFDYFLIPTAEVPVTNYFMGEILDEKDLPKAFCAYTPCFRSEAGSYGRDTKGMKRQHQFNKVELVKFTKPEDSALEHEKLLMDAERILQLLNLPYRVVTLCGGDTGFSSAKTYDIEVWSAAQQGYMEISSCSNFGDFQARRANIRYRSNKDGKVYFVHTLNGSALAVGRTLIAILENFQTKDGQIEVPEVLKKYL